MACRGADVGGHVDGYPRQVWWNAEGETVVKSYTITDMAHGTPLGLADNDEQLWRGRRVPDRGRHLLVLSHREFLRPDRSLSQPTKRPSRWPRRRSPPSAATVSLQSSDVAATLWSKANKPVRQPKPVPREPKRRGIDVGAVITRALTAAGLMK